MAAKKVHHSPAITLSLISGGRSQIFQLTKPSAFICDYSYSTDRTAIRQDKQFSTLQIAVDHGFLFIRQKQKGKKLLFIAVDFKELH